MYQKLIWAKASTSMWQDTDAASLPFTDSLRSKQDVAHHHQTKVTVRNNKETLDNCYLYIHLLQWIWRSANVRVKSLILRLGCNVYIQYLGRHFPSCQANPFNKKYIILEYVQIQKILDNEAQVKTGICVNNAYKDVWTFVCWHLQVLCQTSYRQVLLFVLICF